MSATIDYLLHLADNAVVLGQRDAEWCGHGPILEEDLALANVSLDLIGQARLLYQRAAELKGNIFTAWASCGWKLVFANGKISSMVSPDNRRFDCR